MGFHAAVSNPSLFIYHSDFATVYVLIYVDDKFVTASNSALITDFLSALHSSFPAKDLGMLHYLLGIQVARTSTGLFLSQSRYISELLCAPT